MAIWSEALPIMFGNDPLNTPGEGAYAVNMPDGWLSIETAEERYITSGDGTAYQLQFVDYENGNDANSGSTELLPKKKMTAATKAATYRVMLKRGVTHVYDDAVNPYPMVSGHHVGAYGDINDPKPIVVSTSSSTAIFQVLGTRSNISISDLDIDLSGLANRIAVHCLVQSAGQVQTNIAHRNLRAYGGTATGYAEAFLVQGITTLAQTSNTAEIYDIVYENCTADAVPGHGFHAVGAVGKLVSGAWHGVDYFGCVADGCGSQYDTHGFSSQCAAGYSGTPDKSLWTNSAGNVYYLSLSGATVYNRNVWGVSELIMQLADGSWRLFLENTATPTAPGSWEYGVDTATQRIYVNMAGESLTATSHQMKMAVQSLRGMRWINCIARNQLWPNTTGIREGHGIAFDDFVSESAIINCLIENNYGSGVSINNGGNNRIYGNRILNNTYGQINNNFNIGMDIGHNLIMQSSISPSGMIQSTNSVKDAPGFSGINVMNVYRNAFIFTGQQDRVVAMTGPSSSNLKRILARNNYYRNCQPALTTTAVDVSGVLEELKHTNSPRSWTDF